MDELWGRISELDKARDGSAKATVEAKAEVAHVEQLWAQSAYEIKNNLLDQCRVICPDADFGEIRLDKIVADGRIEVVPDEGDEGVEVPESEPPADP